MVLEVSARRWHCHRVWLHEGAGVLRRALQEARRPYERPHGSDARPEPPGDGPRLQPKERLPRLSLVCSGRRCGIEHRRGKSVDHARAGLEPCGRPSGHGPRVAPGPEEGLLPLPLRCVGHARREGLTATGAQAGAGIGGHAQRLPDRGRGGGEHHRLGRVAAGLLLRWLQRLRCACQGEPLDLGEGHEPVRRSDRRGSEGGSLRGSRAGCHRGA
mmetsp:Transcript_34839/g.110665  ORF Transcript_34839/g.110665 Transcript_34839/m.110665 type:complete len:215 (-) Transcript_34839:52-696(-)